MVKRRTVALLCFSMILAAGAVWVANNWLNIRNAPQQAGENEVNVVVAAMSIPYGQKFDKQHFKLMRLPEDSAPENIFFESTELEGQVSKVDLLEGDIIRKERVSTHLEGVTLASMITLNMRAVTVRVDDVIGVAGFLLPGNHVDVLATKQIKSSGNNRVSTETILKKIKVLAVDQTAGTNKNDPVVVRAVTLELTPKQAEQIVKAREEGNLQLALRNPVEDLEEVVVAKAKPKLKPKKRKYVPTSTSVTIIRGTKAETVKVKL